MKRDLDEFSTTFRSEAGNVLSSTTSVLKDTLRVSTVSVFDTWSVRGSEEVNLFLLFYFVIFLFCRLCVVYLSYRIMLLVTTSIYLLIYIFISLFLEFTARWTRINSKYYEEKCIIIFGASQQCAESISWGWWWRSNCHSWLWTCSAHKVPGSTSYQLLPSADILSVQNWYGFSNITVNIWDISRSVSLVCVRAQWFVLL